jgi:hypothetical protein
VFSVEKMPYQEDTMNSFVAWDQTRREIADMESAGEERSFNRLDSIRALSNVISALENLINQCDGRPEFEALASTALEERDDLKKELKRAIHSY